jgi:hypothetical protein
MKIAQERRKRYWKIMKNKKRSVNPIPTRKKGKLGVKMFFRVMHVPIILNLLINFNPPCLFHYQIWSFNLNCYKLT